MDFVLVRFLRALAGPTLYLRHVQEARMHGRWGERWWAVRLISGHLGRHAGRSLARAMQSLLPEAALAPATRWAFSAFGPSMQPQRHARACARLMRLGIPSRAASRMGSCFLAHDWLRRARRDRLLALPFPVLRQHLRSIGWHDPHALWQASAGRGRVVCVLPTGDLDLAVGAVLDRPGAPAHYVIRCGHAPDSPLRRALAALQRYGHRLDVDTLEQPGMAWRQLKRGASVVTVLDPFALPSSPAGPVHSPSPLRLARLTGVPMVLLGHRRERGGAGTLHVIGEYRGDSLAADARGLRDDIEDFLAVAPMEWMDLDR